jgi:hypothetical protein
VRIAPTSDTSWEPHPVRRALIDNDPSIFIDAYRGGLMISTHCLLPGEEEIIAGALARLLAGAG